MNSEDIIKGAEFVLNKCFPDKKLLFKNNVSKTGEIDYFNYKMYISGDGNYIMGVETNEKTLVYSIYPTETKGNCYKEK